ncbi:MAG: peptidase M49 [Acidobacteriota bacterium]
MTRSPDHPAPRAGACAAALVLAALACRDGGGASRSAPPPGRRTYLLETVGEFAVARLYADGFEDLPPGERVLAYYLFKAALAGRDIYYDQTGRDNLEIRDLLEEILTHPRGLPVETVESIHRYLKLFWINNGNHFERTGMKFLPGFSFEQLLMAARGAMRNGARVRLAVGESLEAKLRRLRRSIFDPEYEPLLTCKSPPRGEDLLSCSSVNFYEGLTLEQAERSPGTHPLNSRLVRRGDRIVEEIYRAGRGDLPAGRYAGDLKKAIGYLEKARSHASAPQAAVLGLLGEYFATGEPEAFRRYNIAWVRLETAVDTISGFIETHKDPRGRKGAFEGIVHIVDPEMTRLQRELAALAPYFEERAPWDDRFKRRGIRPSPAAAVSLLTATGEAGPMPPTGINLPSDEAIRERHGSKSVTLINVLHARREVTRGKLVAEFVASEDRALLTAHGERAALLRTTMHEVLGHASGKVADDLEGPPEVRLREYYSTLEEARAELAALHHFFDPRLIEIGAMASREVAEAAYRELVADDLYLLGRITRGDALQDDHMRATHLIVTYLREVTGAVESVERGGKTYSRVRDIEAMRRGVAELLAEIQRIKGEGDYAAARDLVERFGIRIDPELRDEIVARSRRVGVPSYVAFVMPDIVPVRDASDEVVDARIAYESDFTRQMLQYAGKLPLE